MAEPAANVSNSLPGWAWLGETPRSIRCDSTRHCGAHLRVEPRPAPPRRGLTSKKSKKWGGVSSGARASFRRREGAPHFFDIFDMAVPTPPWRCGAGFNSELSRRSRCHLFCKGELGGPSVTVRGGVKLRFNASINRPGHTFCQGGELLRRVRRGGAGRVSARSLFRRARRKICAKEAVPLAALLSVRTLWWNREAQRTGRVGESQSFCSCRGGGGRKGGRNFLFRMSSHHMRNTKSFDRSDCCC